VESESITPEYKELLALSATQQETIVRLEEDLENILTQFRELKRHVFGRKSEKLDVISPDQQHIFEDRLPDLVLPGEEIEVGTYKRSKRNGRKPIPADIPRGRIEYEPEDQSCSCCGGKLSKIGEDVTEELDFVPASFA